MSQPKFCLSAEELRALNKVETGVQDQRYQSQNEHIDLTKNRNTTILPKVLRFGGPIRFQFTAGATE